MGFSQEQIALRHGLSVKTLARHYQAALEHGWVMMMADLAENAFTQAMAGNTAYGIFLMKTRGKGMFSEKPAEPEGPQESEEEKARRMLERLRAMEATVVGTPDHTLVPPSSA
ncbi:hypothetical protein CR162_21605 [Pseudoroseomonas rhizosphaerae]|uniref:Uncharacterized protein n=2 Tax=Teichococcus rhizosphaerae TaxID=1335062 RepID=A0A2C6XWH1_9PROT|nr:hypothetical protein CR162_21605 [Pseudoroseomonas rhizosphaerae]